MSDSRFPHQQHNPLDDDPELANIGRPADPSPSPARSTPADPGTSSVTHVPPLGPLTDPEPIPVPTADPDAPVPVGGGLEDLAGRDIAAPPKIRTFEQKLSQGHGEEHWKRTPTPTGTNRGACHVRSFHCKLTGDSLEFLDNQINDWLDEHPEYEVKMVTTSVGEWTGKLKEPALIVNVWV